jgi:asparagine synthase (glutamine-hydrolysing)
MCGIVGSVNFKLDTNIIDDVLLHRGPDAQNSWTGSNVSFRHFRLSIQDITGGHQPMSLRDDYVIIYNGEIYNHMDLRKKYSLQCATSSDTETLLHLYDKLGLAFLNEMDAMFAFALFDRKKNQLILAKDRSGKKPLYYYTDKDKFLFASELNCLKALLPLKQDQKNINQYLRFGALNGENTPYHYVKELLPGSYMIVDIGKLAISKKRWWTVNEYYEKKSAHNFDDALRNVDAYLNMAVKRRVESSDLEVGSFLSGGIDSGLVTAIASKYNASLKTFTVSFDGSYDEAPLARLVAQKYNTKHTEISIGFDNLVNDIETILGNYGEPYCDDSAIPSYYVSKEAKKHLTVILNGDGSDEVFGGYRRYVPFSKFDFFNTSGFTRGTASFFKRIIPVAHEKQSMMNYIYRLFDLASKKGLSSYISSTTDIFEGYEKRLINSGSNCLESLEERFEQINQSFLSGLQKIMCMDFNTILPDVLLVKMDIATMAHSLEGRSPFLSKEILEYAPGLNDDFKVKGKTTKFLLRQLAKKYLPGELINQPKRGFEVPLKKWMDSELKEMVFDSLNTTGSYANQFIDFNFVKELLNRKINVSDEKRAKMLFCLLALNIWNKRSSEYAVAS